MRINFSEKPCIAQKEKVLKIYLPVVIVSLITVINLLFFVFYRMENSSSHKKINLIKEKISDYNKKITVKTDILKNISFKKFKKEYYFYYAISVKKRLSWADLFDQFEKTLPPDVKLDMISPKVEWSAILLSISAEAKSKQSELKFVENLEKNPRFSHPFVEYESIDPATGILKFSISVQYRDRK